MKRIFAVAVVLALAAGLVPTVAMGQATPEPGTGSPVASPVAGDVGKAVRWGDWTVTLKGTEFAQTVAADKDFLRKDARGKFAVVRLKIANESLDPIQFPFRSYMVKDAHGRRFEVDLDASDSLMLVEDQIAMDNEQPGIAYDYSLVFDVAKDASGLVLVTANDDTPLFRLGI